MFLFTFSAFRKMGDSTVRKPKLKPYHLHGCQGILFNSQYMKVLSMSNGKHRVCPGALVALCLLAGLYCTNLLADNSARALADSEPASDLIVESVSWSPELPAIGNTVTFTVAVRNQGDSPASSYRLAGFIDDCLFDSAGISQTDPGDTVLKTFIWKAVAGTHVFKAVADYENSITENDESNNDSAYAFSVFAADLVVPGISWAPENPSIGDRVTFSVTVKNDGNITSAGSNVNLNIDGNSRGNRQIPCLGAGENATVTYNWMATSGTHDIEVIADIWSQAKESDETNNYRVVTCSTAAPDLVIDSITWSPQNRTASSNVTMSVKISNQGIGKANYCWVAYYVDDSQKTGDFIEPLKAGASVTKTYSWKAGAGSHAFKAFIDVREEVRENDETNNAMTVTLPDILPDLVVQSITCLSDKPLISHQVKLRVTVKNQGLYSSAYCDLDLHINETYTLHQLIPMIAPGETAVLPFSWVTQASYLNLRAVADVDNIIHEVSEDNNTKTVKIGFSHPSPDTDLTIENVTWVPAEPSVGDTVTVTINIKNKGPGLVGSTHVDYYIDDVFLDSVYTGRIESGDTILNSVTWQAVPGTHTIRATVDCDNNVFETDETNNEKAVTITTVAPDLVIQDIAWSPINPQKGEEVDLTVTVKNQGNYNAGDSYISYYVDDSSQGSHVIEDIKPGATVIRSFSWPVQADSTVFKVVLDEFNYVKESDESNNEKTVFLPAPDLVIEGIARSPDNPSENATVTFIVNIKNLGAGPAMSPHITVYIDDTFLASIQFNDINPGDSTTGACIWTAQNGEHVFNAVADADESITESDESNNEKSMKLSVSQPMIEEPVQETSTETENKTTPTSTITTKNVDIVEMMLGDNSTAEEDIAGDISSTSPADSAWWQKILTNRFVIIGVAVLGIGALAVLFLLRRRSHKNQAVE